MNSNVGEVAWRRRDDEGPEEDPARWSAHQALELLTGQTGLLQDGCERADRYLRSWIFDDDGPGLPLACRAKLDVAAPLTDPHKAGSA